MVGVDVAAMQHGDTAGKLDLW
ncbi:MAG: hypothetical protein RL033_2418, partial [Pseudomonadota bacterium]